ncbi:MAG: hypothetical protein KY459_12545 [Acidobacteria bacterium]|nr:hypothetical protein [Acidobacteriota bacterium]
MEVKRAIAAIVMAVVCLPAGADQKLYSRQTEFLNLIYYTPEHEYLTYHLARSFENSLRFHRELFDYTPSEEVVLLMQDFGDFGHGGTSTVPWNYLSIGIEPFDYVYETMPANERMNWLMHHELVHVVATDKAAPQDEFWRSLFRGKVTPIAENPISMFYSYLTSPRWYSPRWYHEGIAVFLETWMAGGIGRVLGGYDEMVFRTMALEDAYFYDIVGLESEGTTIDFQVGQNSYLYGTRFVTWLAAQYGPEKLLEWFDRSEGSERYFAAQFEKVYGRSLDDEWSRWIAWEAGWQRDNLERIHEYPVTRGEPLHPETLGSVSRSHYDPERNELYVAITRPAEPARIVALDIETGELRNITEVDSPALYYVTSLAWDPQSGKLFYTSDNSGGWRDLEVVDIETGKSSQLLKDARIGDLVVHPKDQSIWAVQHHNGLSTLVRIPPPWDGWNTILTLDYGRDIFDLAISNDGKTLTCSMIDISGRQQLVRLDIERLLSGDSSYDILYEFENNTPANFVFSPDDRYLYGTSYYTGVSNIFRYDFESGEIEALSNAETGLVRPLPISDDELIAFRYTAEGFVPVSIPIEVTEDVNAIRYLGQEVINRHPQLEEWMAGSPADVDLREVTTYTGEYKPFESVGLTSVYPIVEGYKDSVAVGLRFNFADPLGLHMIDATVAVSPEHDLDDEEMFHFSASWDHAPWKARLRYNDTDFYDLFGPTKTSRKGYSASLAHGNYLIYERPRVLDYTLTGSWYGGIDTLPEYQNVSAPFDEFATFDAQLNYRNLKRTIGAVDYERGTQWALQGGTSWVNDELFTKVHGIFDYGFLLPIDHTSLWIRSSAGTSFGDRDNAFANFFFGGFGNNWVDDRPVRRYRNFYAFPGLELNEAGAATWGKVTLELTLPPVRFERVGVPGLYARWARAALFTSGLVTNFDESELRDTLGNIGAQVDVSLVMFSNLDATFSFGYAVAERGDDTSDEFMASLKLLR